MLSTKEQITPNHESALKVLAEIVDHGAEVIQRSAINFRGLRNKKRFLYSMIVASQSHTESIHALCREGRTASCWSLLRVLLENLINSKYLHALSSEDSFDKFILWGYNEQLKCLEKVLGLSSDADRAKQIGVPSGVITLEIQKLKKLITKLETKIPKPHNGQDLYSRADRLDKFNGAKKRKSFSFLVLYEMMYRLLSGDTHLSPKGLAKFVIPGSESLHEVMLSGNPKEICPVIQYTIFIYRNMIEMFITIFDKRKGLTAFNSFCNTIEAKYQVNWNN